MMTILPLVIGWTEILIIAGIVLLLFGAAKIPSLMRSMGKGINEFKKGMNEKDEPTSDEPQAINAKKSDDSTIDEQSGK